MSRERKPTVHILATPKETGGMRFAVVLKDEWHRAGEFSFDCYPTREDATREAREAIAEGAIDAYVVEILLQDLAVEGA